MRSLLTGTAIFLSTTIVSTTIYAPAYAQEYSFSSIRVEGNTRIDAGTVASQSGIAAGQPVSAGQLNEATRRMVESGLYETVELAPQGGTLVIRVAEAPVINTVAFEGNARIKDEQMTSLVRSKSSGPYVAARAESDAATIAQAYAESGRPNARVTPKVIRRDGNRVDLVFEISEGRITEVERIAFTGNRAYSDRRLREVLSTKQAGLLRTFVQRDTYSEERQGLDRQLLTDFYRSRGYIDFQLLGIANEFAPDRGAFFLTYNVREGLKYTYGHVGVTSEIPGVDAAMFQKGIRISEGGTYSPNGIDNSIARMEAMATRNGMDFIRIEPQIVRNPRTQTLDVTFKVTRGPRIFVERIDIEGNATTLDRVIRRQFRTVEGDPFNPTEIRQAAERIRALGFFSSSSVDTRQGSAADQVLVDVNVTEQPTGSLSFGFSYGVDAGAGVALSLSERNFLGRGQYLGVSINTTNSSGTSRISFREPAFLGRDLSAGFDAYYRTYDNDNADYSMDLIGIEPTFGFPLNETMRAEVGLLAKQNELYSVDEDSSAILHDEEGKTNGFGVKYSIDYDSRRSGLANDRGLKLSFGQEFYGLGGDVKAIKTSASAVADREVFNGDWTLRAGLEGGAFNTFGGYDSRVTDRFWGSQMRGFESRGIGPRDMEVDNEDPLGGNYYAVAKFDAEFPLGLPEEYGIKGGLFLDIGSVWGLDQNDGGLTSGDGTGLVDDSAKIRAAAGFSVFMDTPIGPLRLNFSKALAKEDYDKEQNFDLTVSTQF
ncbi:outer membrane protein assembly factor BamA [Frigidibacter sp. MR17.24]|uniref:outer membrane protein assembly factor BamA n=1 Tax=Frigidibacter sp. MR17.24 TaxID=3127345 RepID=UPI0030130B40